MKKKIILNKQNPILFGGDEDEDEDDTDDEMEEIIDYEMDDTKTIGEEDIQFDTSSCKLNNQYSLNEWPTINDENISEFPI